MIRYRYDRLRRCVSNYVVTALGKHGTDFNITDRTTGVVDDIHGVENVRFSDAETAATGFISTDQSFDGTTLWGGSIVGGTGVDTISYANANYAIYVDLERDGGYAQALNAERWDAHVTGVENLTGATSYLNSLWGDEHDNILIGGDSFDWLAGRGGNNILDGGGYFDMADYYVMSAAVSIDLTTGKAVHSTGTDTLISIEEVRVPSGPTASSATGRTTTSTAWAATTPAWRWRGRHAGRL